MADLLWGPKERPAKGPKPALTLDRIVAEAIALADAEGIAALSMKSLAARLHVGTMSLYRYLPSKDDLVALMLDTVIGEPPSWPSDVDWRTGMREWAMLNLAVFDRHAWMLPAVGAPRRMGPNEVGWSEAAFKILEDGGAPPDRFVIVMAVNSFVRGAAHLSTDPNRGPTLDIEAMAAAGALERYPHLLRAAEQAASTDNRAAFTNGLDRLLEGIAARA